MLTEKTLDQILGVLDLTEKYCRNGMSLSKAYQKSVKEIALKYSVRYQTIADGCRRRLNLNNVNEFMELLREWLAGNNQKLKDLLSKNINAFKQYKLDNFFKETGQALSSAERQPRKVEETVESILFSIPSSIASQLRTIAEAKGETIQDLSSLIINEYVTANYVEYLKDLISSLPQKHKEQVIEALRNQVELE